MRRIYCKLLITTLVLSASGQSSRYANRDPYRTVCLDCRVFPSQVTGQQRKNINVVYETNGDSVERTICHIKRDSQSLEEDERLSICIFKDETVTPGQIEAFEKVSDWPRVQVVAFDINEIEQELLDREGQQVLSNIEAVYKASYRKMGLEDVRAERISKFKAMQALYPFLFGGRLCKVGSFLTRDLFPEPQENSGGIENRQSEESCQEFSYDMANINAMILSWGQTVYNYFLNHYRNKFERNLRERIGQYLQNPVDDVPDLYMKMLQIVSPEFKSSFRIPFIQERCVKYINCMTWLRALTTLISAYHGDVIIAEPETKEKSS